LVAAVNRQCRPSPLKQGARPFLWLTMCSGRGLCRHAATGTGILPPFWAIFPHGRPCAVPAKRDATTYWRPSRRIFHAPGATNTRCGRLSGHSTYASATYANPPTGHPCTPDGTRMMIRYSKIACVAAIALFASLVALGNITDYGSNLVFVRHVLSMDTIFPDATIHYRAIQSPMLHHLAYGFIIFMEALTAVICWLGTWRLLRVARQPAAAFNKAKSCAVAGLTLGFLVWQVGFMSIGGEWFGMWMSAQWN